MSQVVGKATLEVEADASSLEAGLAKAEGSIKSLETTAARSSQRTSGSFRSVGDAAGEAAQRMEAQSRRYLASLKRESDQVGRTRSEYLALRAEELGVKDAAQPMLERMRQAEQSLNRVGVSAAQTAAAMRMVPAQMTDIVTQLAGGQNALLILTQQGGQLKDMFGGVGPAIRGLGSYVAGLVTPLTAAAAAASVFGLAIYKGSQEAVEFNKSLILTGNYVGKTAEQLSEMAGQISKTIGTQGQASEVLNKLAGTGKIAGDQIQGIGVAAMAMNKATSASVDETIKMFVALGEEPTKASAKLNEQYHYLTASVYDQIRALEEEGHKEEAAALAQQTLAVAMKERADKVLEKVGFLERGWNSVATAAKKAWDEMLGWGRPETLDDVKAKIAAAKAEIAKMGDAGPGWDSTAGGAAVGNGNKRRAAAEAKLRFLEAKATEMEGQRSVADAEGQQTKQNAEGVAAKSRLAEQDKRMRGRAKQREDEIDQLKRDAKTTGMAQEEFQKRLAFINEHYKDKGAVNTAAAAVQNALAGEIAALEGYGRQVKQIEKQTQLDLEFERNLGLISEREFIQKSSENKENALIDQQAIAELEAETAGGRKSLAERERYAAKVREIEEQIANVRKEGANAVAAYDKKTSDSLNAYIGALDNSLKVRLQEISQNIGSMGLGDVARDELNRIQQANRDFDQKFYDLSRSRRENRIGEDEYQDQLAALRKYQTERVLAEQGATQQMRDAQSSWALGASRALENYRDSAGNVFKQTEELANRSFSGMEDSITRFVTTGKLSFNSLAESFIADTVRMQVRAAGSGVLGMLGPAIRGMFGSAEMWNGGIQGVTGELSGSPLTGVFLKSSGGLISGPGTGTSDSIPAMLSNGEFVVKAAATARHRGVLEAINAGGAAARFASGGYVDGAAVYRPTLNGSGAVPQGAAGGVTVNVTLVEDSSKAGQVEHQRNGSQVDIQAFVERIVDRRVSSSITSGGNMISNSFERSYLLSRTR
ncbi:phage tail tape measure protein [Cupriavidus basilensis]|uniref:Phage tail tape measure protein n=1 Tax=Cupriavidus basilensis TaxID=68895 RepID=A0ABT6AX09_9BURK|nr:phage tail tape measure protein [Cupriavidus basilensis]MDF3837155.1 phage tail tape measure protein [Cupriavidus basilensis]